ncbi:MAG: HmuY family protein [Rhodothermia bacterium]|nr:MAG: HmuY family protein [Rhodothermia bacterium]
MSVSNVICRRAIALFVFSGLVGVGLTASAQESNSLDPVTVSDIDASGDAVHFSFIENRVVSDSEAEAGLWDIRFEGTSIYVNGEAQLLERTFDYIARAPEDGYEEDDVTEGPAIQSANGTGWFDYDPNTHIVSPIPDRTIVVHTLNDTYAKLEILSYYLGGVEDGGTPRNYTFRYVYQPDGSRDLR